SRKFSPELPLQAKLSASPRSRRKNFTNTRRTSRPLRGWILSVRSIRPHRGRRESIMAVFTYKASDLSSAEQIGTITADSPRQARDLLRQRGLVIRDIAQAQSASQSARVSRPHRGMRHQTSTFIRELSTLLAVGVPLLEALNTIAAQHHGRFKTSVLLLRERVASGSSLAQAMREQPEVFDDLCVNLTEVGEDAGTLD